MSIVAVVGPTSSTTALALASTWPTSVGDTEVVLVDADPAGGVYAAWLDLPTTPGLASAVSSPGSAGLLEHVQRSAGGLGVLVGAVRSVEATRTVHEAAARVLPQLAPAGTVAIVDGGRRCASSGIDPLLAQADVVVVCVRQRAGSAVAVAADLERTAELCDSIAARAIPLVLAVIGTRPFPAAEIAAYVAPDGAGLTWCEIADDPWSAGVLAGRAGSTRRLQRSPLLASAASASTHVQQRLSATAAVRR